MSTRKKSDSSKPLDAVVAVYSQVPENAVTADLLGAERSGHGIRIREDGLIVTVGYLVIEAEQIWVTSHCGQGAPGYVVAQDYDSGLALLKTSLPIGENYVSPGCIDDISAGALVEVYRCGETEPFLCELVSKQEFAGRWEYLLDEALFTSPACEDWAGAALFTGDGKVYGIGSLLMDIPVMPNRVMAGNMFIPIDLIAPYIDEMCQHGRRLTPPRPWLGSMIQEYEGKLIVVGVYRDCPADLAGVKPGDIVVSVNDEPVNSLSEMFRKVWSLGSAGVEVPLTISRPGKLRTCRLQSIDRSIFHQHSMARSVN